MKSFFSPLSLNSLTCDLKLASTQNRYEFDQYGPPSSRARYANSYK